ncbi:hypothetical protein CSC94_12790 [Zhengella mangrovi]|uniref:Uncharacterized protein n=1 Tax=Zhengella mangrovi TaxID=1982044 RepID=A0A2G1QM80_9HYPH|nr:hypothetical protein [Zhengella mangrovi]PHP66560.1 hypothetical protein CSC94_12790 [Zhengella mangrovi]
MADFNPSFADGGERRAPTSTERNLGMACGPADYRLFNYLFNLMQGQVEATANEAGVTSNSDGDKTVLLRAIQALIAAATGEGDTSGFILFTQARSRLPIFPDTQTANGRVGVTSPTTGVVRIPAGITFLHRGIFPVVTTLQDFATAASKVYHLRWRYNGGTPEYILADTVAGGAYNPSSLDEDDIAFDSTYDDMLIARVVTNSSNVPTITDLANKAFFSLLDIVSKVDGVSTLNWARLPAHLKGDPDFSDMTRYETTASVTGSWAASSRKIVAGKGLTGGGDLTEDRTLTMRINTLDALSGAVDDGDQIALDDLSANKSVRISVATLRAALRLNPPGLNDIGSYRTWTPYPTVTSYAVGDTIAGSTFGAGIPGTWRVHGKFQYMNGASGGTTDWPTYLLQRIT